MSEEPAGSDAAAPTNRAGDLEWTEAVIVRLRALVADGMSAGAIARDLSAHLGVPVTRSMVCGKLHRLGIKLATKPPVKAKPPPPVRSEPAPVMALPFAPPAVAGASEPPEVASPGLPLAEIRAFQCRWPVSRDGEPFRFCGAPFDPANTYSWCPKHMAVGIDQRTRAQMRKDNDQAAMMRTGKAKAA